MAKKRMAKTAPWKDRIRELRRVPASSLVRHPKNPRQHPESQKAAMQAMLKRVGYADALLVREDADGALHLIDGEMRSEIAADAEVPGGKHPVFLQTKPVVQDRDGRGT